jgi:hypothetical protein
MNIHPSKLNELLSSALRNRVASEMFYISGVAGFWRAVGIGFVGLGFGVAIGVTLYGYSFIARNSNNTAMLSQAFAKALSGVQLSGIAEGTVQLEPSEISLAKGQEVSLEGSSRLLLDPSAKVLAEGEIKVQMPSIPVPQNIPRPASRNPTIANFTIFKSVPYEKGSVLTGWTFLTSAQTAPTSQYCYYHERGDDPDIALQVEVGNDEIMATLKDGSKSIDLSAAFNRCVWFRRDIQ